MIKKTLLIIILILPIECFALDIPELKSNYAIVYDLTTNETIYEKNIDTKTSVASLTKILTLMTALEKINDLNVKVEITSTMLENIPYYASVAGLEVGDIVTYNDLLYATLLPSGADAAEALAISLSGSTANFLNDMNDLSMRIGMSNSNFQTTTGLDRENQYSTTRDILKLLIYALKNPLFKEIYTTKTYTLTNNLTVNSTLTWYQKKYNIETSRIIGSKTGHTKNAGTCLSSYVNVNNHELIIITIGAPYSNTHAYNFLDHLDIITYLDDLYLSINDLTSSENNYVIASNFPESYSSKSSFNYIKIPLLSFLTIGLFLIFKHPKHKSRVS